MTIRVTCPRCGQVTVAREDITVRPCVDDATHSSYWFICPDCSERVSHLAHPQIVGLLVDAAANVDPWFLPIDLFEQHVGPPIVLDDLIDLHLELEAL